MMFQYFLPTRIVFGRHAIADLAKHLKGVFHKARSILLVTGKSHLRAEGATDRIIKLLQNFDVYLVDSVEPGPTAATLQAALKQYRQNPTDLVLAIGGGSVLDLGKAISVLATNRGTLAEYQSGKPMRNDAVPFVAIPTTTGTASEMTVWSVITNSEGAYAGRRKSFSDPRMYPKLAIIDPELTMSLPREQTVGTALDILSASVESIWSKKRNPISTVFGLAAIRLVMDALPKVYDAPDDGDERERLCLASLYCGFSVSNSRTGAPHKVSYPLSSHFGLPHGLACALTLPAFLAFIGRRKPELLDEILPALGCRTPEEAAEALRAFLKRLGCPSRLSEAGVTSDTLPLLERESYVPAGEQEDPVAMTPEDFRVILESAL